MARHRNDSLMTSVSMPASTAGDVAAKLHGIDAGHCEDAPMSVIIEVRSKPVRLRGGTSGWRHGTPPMVSPVVAPRSAGSQEAVRQDLSVVQHRLATMSLPEEPVLLDRAHALVASLDGAQLRLVAAMPEVAAIRANRTYRKPARRTAGG